MNQIKIKSHIARILRPSKFCNVLGQDISIKLIKNALEKNLMPPVCTIFGPSGVGKTTIARLIALWECCTNRIENEPCGVCANCKAILSGTHPDVFELDAGTYTGVDNIKSMLENIDYATSLSTKRIYILDEVHMLSKHSMTSLLKKFEEPLENIQFILATTNVEKLPDTILSRSFRIRLERIDDDVIKNYLIHIAKDDGYSINDNAIKSILYASQGSMRQALSIFEQLSILCDGEIDDQTTTQMLGLASKNIIDSVLLAFDTEDIDMLCSTLVETKELNPSIFMKQILSQIQEKIRNKNASKLLIDIAYDLAEASVVMHKSPHSENILEICLGHALLKNSIPKPKLSELAKKIF